VRPLFIGLDPSEGEVHCYNDSVEPLAIYQTKELPHLLHPIGTRPLRPPGVTHQNLIDVTRHIWPHLPDVEPLRSPILHVHVKRDGDILIHHPIPKLQIGAADHSRSGPPSDLTAEEMEEKVEMGKDS